MIHCCDYKDDFKKSDTGVSFHYFNSNYGYYHTHNYWEIFVITSGSLYHTINGKKLTIEKNDCFIIRPSDVHVFTQIDNIQSQHINVMITDESIHTILDAIGPNLYHMLLNYPDYVYTHLKDNEYLELNNLIDKFYLSEFTLSTTMLIKYFIIDAVKFFYINNPLNISSFDKTELERPKWISDLINKMKSVQCIALSINEVCEDIPFSEVHISRLFKQYMDITIGKYFNDIKLEYACKLLTTSNFSTLDICSRIGYSSLSHFNRIFKKRYGITPKTYRKDHHNE